MRRALELASNASFGHMPWPIFLSPAVRSACILAPPACFGCLLLVAYFSQCTIRIIHLTYYMKINTTKRRSDRRHACPRVDFYQVPGTLQVPGTCVHRVSRLLCSHRRGVLLNAVWWCSRQTPYKWLAPGVRRAADAAKMPAGCTSTSELFDFHSKQFAFDIC